MTPVGPLPGNVQVNLQINGVRGPSPAAPTISSSSRSGTAAVFRHHRTDRPQRHACRWALDRRRPECADRRDVLGVAESVDREQQHGRVDGANGSRVGNFAGISADNRTVRSVRRGTPPASRVITDRPDRRDPGHVRQRARRLHQRVLDRRRVRHGASVGRRTAARQRRAPTSPRRRRLWCSSTSRSTPATPSGAGGAERSAGDRDGAGAARTRRRSPSCRQARGRPVRSCRCSSTPRCATSAATRSIRIRIVPPRRIR